MRRQNANREVGAICAEYDNNQNHQLLH